jgi:hypothetical protein
MPFLEEADEYRLAAAKGDVDVLKKLMALAPDHRLAIIEANHFALFRDAATRGDLLLLRGLVALTPDKVSEMLASGEPFFIPPLPFLEYKEDIDSVRLIAPEGEHAYQALHMAAINKHEAVINYLLSFPEVMAYAERYSEYECWIAQYKAKPSLTVETALGEPPPFVLDDATPCSRGRRRPHTPRMFSPRRANDSSQQENPTSATLRTI